eukprot:4303982-Alexandrium_andersonii.AAC.1
MSRAACSEFGQPNCCAPTRSSSLRRGCSLNCAKSISRTDGRSSGETRRRPGAAQSAGPLT